MRSSFRRRYAVSVNTRGTSIKVAGSFGMSSIKRSSAFRMYCSNIGPIVSGGKSLLKMLCISFTMNVFSSGRL